MRIYRQFITNQLTTQVQTSEPSFGALARRLSSGSVIFLFTKQRLFHTGSGASRRPSAMQCIRQRIRRESGDARRRTVPCRDAPQRIGFSVKEP